MTSFFPGARPVDVIPGDPVELRWLAGRLGVLGGSLGNTAGELGAIDADGWKGLAANAFRRAVKLQPARYFDAATGFSAASTGLLGYAQALEWAQQDAGRAITAHQDAESASAAWRERQHAAAAEASAQAATTGNAAADPPSLESNDPGDPARAQAESIVASARASLDAAAARLRATLADAQLAAPTEPGLFGGLTHGAEYLTAGVVRTLERISDPGGRSTPGLPAKPTLKAPVTHPGRLPNVTQKGVTIIVQGPAGKVTVPTRHFLTMRDVNLQPQRYSSAVASQTLRTTINTLAKDVKDGTMSRAAATKRVAVVARALNALGIRYVYSGGDQQGPSKGDGGAYATYASSHWGFDCSGLVMYAYAGIVNLPHYSGDGGQFSMGTKVSRSQLEPGDLVFFEPKTGETDPQHVGIYVGGGKFGKFINAPHTWLAPDVPDFVRVDPLRSDLLGAVRLIPPGVPAAAHASGGKK